MQGIGFKALVNEGDKVVAGQKLIEFDPEAIKVKAPSNIIVIILTEPADTKITPTKESSVKTGEFLFSV
jgi:phosphotransferase system IIA component